MAVLALIPSRTRIPVLVVLDRRAGRGASPRPRWAPSRSTLPVGEARPGARVLPGGAPRLPSWSPRSSPSTGWRPGPAALGTPGRRRSCPSRLTAVAAVDPGARAWLVRARRDPASSTDDRDTGIPAYMVQDSLRGPGARHPGHPRRASTTGLTYAVRRGDGVTIGEDEILAADARSTPQFDADVRELISRPRAAVVARLAEAGIQYVVLPAPADGDRGRRARRLRRPRARRSAEDRATRAWEVEPAGRRDALDGPGSWLRIVLLVLQGVAIVAGAGAVRRPSGGREEASREPAERTRGRRVALPPVERVARRVRLNADRRARRRRPAAHRRRPRAGATGRPGRDRPPADADRPQPGHPHLPEQPDRRPHRVSRPARAASPGSVERHELGRRRRPRPSRCRPTGRREPSPGDGPVTVRGTDAMAPGLVAAPSGRGTRRRWRAAHRLRTSGSPGLGAAAGHQSVLELVNPDPGPAVADIT